VSYQTVFPKEKDMLEYWSDLNDTTEN